MAKSKLTQTIVKRAIVHQKEMINHFTTCKDKGNPQIIEMREKHVAYLEVLEAVLYSLQGSNALLSTFLPYKPGD